MSDHRPRTREIHPSLQPWIGALRELCDQARGRNWSHALAAEVLSSLTPPAIEVLHKIGWTRPEVERLADACQHGAFAGKRQRFTRVRVLRYCKMLGIVTKSKVCRDTSTFSQRRRIFQEEKRWGNLLAAHVLSKRQVQILCLLRDAGPGTKHQIADALGVSGKRPLMSSGRSDLQHLVQAGLIVSSEKSPNAPRAVYSLSPTARGDQAPRRDTGVEVLYG